MSVTLAPIGAALAVSAPADPTAMVGMADCPSKVAKQTSKDCGCCDTKAPCQSDLCLAKCFKMDDIPVYDGKEENGGTVKGGLDRVQRTETAELRTITRP